MCLFLVLGGGTAVALSGSNTVFSDDIVDNQVKSADVRDDTLSGGGLAPADLRAGSVGASEVADDSLTGADILNGSLGPTEFGTIPAARATQLGKPDHRRIYSDGHLARQRGFDTASLHDTATNNSRLTAPVAGVYQINGQVHWDNDAAGVRQLQIEKNRGTGHAKTIAEEMETASDADDMTQDVSTISRLSAGDHVELRVVQTFTGTDVDTLAVPGNAPELSMAWIGT